MCIFESRVAAQSIRITGDGRCNIANRFTQASNYLHSDFVSRAFETVSPDEAYTFLESCGIVMREEAQGRLYPLSNKASEVARALLHVARHQGVGLFESTPVERVMQEGSSFRLRLAHDMHVRAHAVVVCTGGAGIEHLELPRDLSRVPIRQIVGPLACKSGPLRGLDKARAKVALTAKGVREEGEVTFRTYGISGIVAFNMSRLVGAGDTIEIDFLPMLEAGDEHAWALRRSLLMAGIAEHATPYEYRDDAIDRDDLTQEHVQHMEPMSWEWWTCGLFIPAISQAILKKARISPDQMVDESSIRAFLTAARHFKLTVCGMGDARLCQVYRGGVSVDQIDPHTMETPIERLFVCGEALDIDAPCGGYNLHWAWISGLIAALGVQHV